MEVLASISDNLGMLFMLLLALITIIAVVRTVIKLVKGKSISVPPVGAMNDLPSSITGINKHDDMAERLIERTDKKTE
jgi:hypothetical protein